MTTDEKYEFMGTMAEKYFGTEIDPDQIPINDPKTEEKLAQLSREYTFWEEENGVPIGWIFVIPTTAKLKEDFLKKHITEREMFFGTPYQDIPEALYLCAALVLPEHRRKGVAERLAVRAVEYYRALNPAIAFFCWVYSGDGAALVSVLEERMQIPVQKKFSN